VRFVPTQPVMRCQDEVGFDFTAFRRVGLPQSAVETLRNGPKKLATLPRQFPYERDRRLQKWSQSPLSIEAREALEFAMVGAVAAVEHAGCHNIDSDRIRSAVSDSLRKPTTFYMFQYKRVGDQVLPEALDFRILDLADGILFELVNFS
jgi:hypothetical protein